ncbi:uncharacterized protein METZ01_LOCUS45743 [marine metagenome]|uniref:Uncharacterized protein n=1 Tax=marine metagenome TaxID=408172 RepID=A0A381RPB0_9ZZZZ
MLDQWLQKFAWQQPYQEAERLPRRAYSVFFQAHSNS